MPPAARITDMHTCPMATPGTPPIPHVGGPVTLGAATVKIGFLPAARMGDMATCVGPPDTIAMGSPTVKIEYMMAARMGDPTIHGGIITMGCPNVIIGEVGMGGAASTSGGGAPLQGAGIVVSPLCAALGAQIDQLDEVAERAALASDVYDAYDPDRPADQAPPPPPPGFQRLSDDPQKMREFFKGRLSDEQIKNLTAPDNSSYRAAIYQNEAGKTFVVFRGTENKEGLADWKVNFSQGSGFGSQHYEASKELATAVSQTVGPENMEVVGHSKGGGMAAAGGTVTGAKTTTFNSAGLHGNTVEGYDLSKSGENIDSYVVDGEVLNWAQDNRRVIHGAAAGAAGWLGGPLAGIGTGLAVKDTAPQSVGNRHALPAVWKPGEEPPWYDPVMFRVTLHGMPKVQEALAAQREGLVQSYDANGCPAQTGPK